MTIAQFKICVVLFALVSLNEAVVAPPFAVARTLIRPGINYDQLCSEKYEGGDKVACRLKDPNRAVGFLVCKTAIVDGAACAEIIQTEVEQLKLLRNSQVKTVAFDEEIINGVPCGKNPAEVCSGYLVGWVSAQNPAVGFFAHIRDSITSNTIGALIQEVKLRTSAVGKAITVADLTTIRNFMEAPATKYRQICDLQGFFLLDGGFLVNDVPNISEKIGLADRCWEPEDPNEPPEPTTQEVLTALNTMITEIPKP